MYYYVTLHEREGAMGRVGLNGVHVEDGIEGCVRL